jgi:hypothetical protein
MTAGPDKLALSLTSLPLAPAAGLFLQKLRLACKSRGRAYVYCSRT